MAANPESASPASPCTPWQYFLSLTPLLTTAQAGQECPKPAQALPLGQDQGGGKGGGEAAQRMGMLSPQEEARRAPVPETGALGLSACLGAASILV